MKPAIASPCRLYILGIGGTLMGAIATLAQEAGYTVSGADAQPVYPPVSDSLQVAGIPYQIGYDIAHLDAFQPDQIVVGNALSRGMPLIETLLNRRIPFQSAPQWLQTQVFPNRQVIAVSGTHGKTTTSSLLAFLLHQVRIDAGFLIGGIPQNFGKPAHLGTHPLFVIEADEYDTAFFDKRPKFVHWQPHIWVINNLEYDHADIYPDLSAMIWAYHQGMRNIPGHATVVLPADPAQTGIAQLLEKGCWSQRVYHGLHPDSLLAVEAQSPDSHSFHIRLHHAPETQHYTGDWALCGAHQLQNLASALTTLQILSERDGLPSLSAYLPHLPFFQGVKRRLEIKVQQAHLTIYDDFAHHPTAIAETLRGLRARIGPQAQLLVALDVGSHTMKMGVHANRLHASLSDANGVYAHQSTDLPWDLAAAIGYPTYPDLDSLYRALHQAIQACQTRQSPCHVVVMSNGAFGGLHHRLQQAWGPSPPDPTP